MWVQDGSSGSGIFHKTNQPKIVVLRSVANSNCMSGITSHRGLNVDRTVNVKQRWQCGLCEKLLSSKRSYTEHMNTHKKKRPFMCDSCTYSAASHMTLRRHILRNHTDRSKWGYPCPYCENNFVEPAAYQLHVTARHFGLSATYGCPVGNCSFKSLSLPYFRTHLIKHPKREYGFVWDSLSEDKLRRYLIDDNHGNGWMSKHTSISARPSQRELLRIRHCLVSSSARSSSSRATKVAKLSEDIDQPPVLRHFYDGEAQNSHEGYQEISFNPITEVESFSLPRKVDFYDDMSGDDWIAGNVEIATPNCDIFGGQEDLALD